MNANFLIGQPSARFSMPVSSRFDALHTLIFGLCLLFMPHFAWSQLAQFNFPATNSLVVSAKDANVTVSNMSLSTGTIETNITTGTYFPNEPYVQESGGWTATTQTLAKNYTFTITAASGYIFSITNVSFRAYASSSGPSVYGFAVGSTNIYSVNAPSAKVVAVNQAVTGQTGLTTAVVKLQGWINGSRAASGTGIFRLDDVIITGVLTPVQPPNKLVITAIAPTTPSVGSGFSVTVQSQDLNSNPSNVLTATAFSLSTNNNAGAIGGTITGSIGLGSNTVILTGVTLSTIGIVATITATRTSGDVLTAGTSPPFNVLAAASKLAFVGVPTTGMTLTNFTSFTVEARRADNSVDNSFTGNISLVKATGLDTLSGTKTVAAVAGVATFTNIQIGKADTYTLTASATGLTNATSDNIVVSTSSIIAWTNATSVWYLNTNWTPATSVWQTTHIAQFSDAGTSTRADINLNGAPLSIGAIEVISTRTRDLLTKNSSTSSPGTLTLNGTTVNGLPNTIIRHAGSGNLYLQNSTQSMTIALGNVTENVIVIDGIDSIEISAPISGTGKNLTLDGLVSGQLTLFAVNTFSGTFKVKSGTARLNTNMTIDLVTDIVVESNGYLYTGPKLTNGINDNANIVLNGDAALDISGGTETIGTLSSSSPTSVVYIGDNTTNAGDFTVGNATNTLFAGIIDGVKAAATSILTKQGAGKFTLTGDNTYLGLTTINGGILQLNNTNGNTIPATNDVTITGGTLQISSNQTLNNLILNGGNVVIDDGITLTINGVLTLTSGKITLGTTGTGNVIMGASASILPANPTSASYIVTNGSGSLTQIHVVNALKIYPIGSSATAYDPVKITPNGACSFSVKVASSINQSYTLSSQHANNATPRQWDISLLSGTPTVTLSLTSSNLTRPPSTSSGIIGHWNNTTWDDLQASYATGTWTAVGVSTFSPFIVSYATPLSISLKDITVEAKDKYHLLNWTTLSEKNNAYFDIQHATDNLFFKSIGQIKGQGTVSNTNNYTYNYTPNPSVKTHYYRLRQVDFDGSETLSKTVSIESINKNSELNIYPNNASDKLTVNYESDKIINYNIFNLFGQTVQSGQLNEQKELIITQLSTGMYLLKIENSTVKFFKN